METVKQLSRYEEVSPNVYKCPQIIHDDAVSSLWLALYYLTTYFYDPSATNPELSRSKEENNEPTRDIFFDMDDPFAERIINNITYLNTYNHIFVLKAKYH